MGASDVLEWLASLTVAIGLAIKAAAGIVFTVLVTKLADRLFDKRDDDPGGAAA
jgi:hypothetical protein